MRKIIVDGKEIITNYEERTMDNLVSGNDLPIMIYIQSVLEKVIKIFLKN